MTASTAMRYHLLNQEVFDAGYNYSALPAHARDAVKSEEENLRKFVSAPWDMYTKHIFPKIGYVAKAERVESNDFYVPQTRQRGYLVAMDVQYLFWHRLGHQVCR
ncbi:uncharacterized protein B0T15DRAFT_491930 [Chaetomium strumarium]|uniref:Uncharacterized protein n=1 Tax=Chaetomium strumarium TaxID=1170767 RepID=A0AAJ0M2C5_9PEZI|nr:hypothetical protein B0T15DRAFT_491930 [Chaetomium strumarium]